MIAILVKNLEKHFKIPISCKGNFVKRINNYLFPKYQIMKAVNNISFNIQSGERVAFIGPNGAGKSTTIKILTGIMHSTAGRVEVLGKIPSKSRKSLAYKIGAVFGQRSQLLYHLPVRESLTLLASIYDIPHFEYKKRLMDLSKKFEIVHLLDRLVRQLSLGERMRCEIVANFLHQPLVLFLDEPTIGLDINAKTIIRKLIREQSEQMGTTLLLTSHDTDDIEKVCDRVIIIDRGKLLLDDELTNLKTKYIRKKIVTLATEGKISLQKPGVTIIEQSFHHLKIEIDQSKCILEDIVAELLKNYSLKDLTIEGPPLENIIKALYCYENE